MKKRSRAPRQSIRRFPACGRTSILCSLDRRRAIARIPLRHTGFDLLDHYRPTLRPTHPWPRLSRRSDASRFRALAGARDQRPWRSDGPHAVLRHHRRSGRDPAHRLAVPRAQAGREAALPPPALAQAPAPPFHDPRDGASPPPPPDYRTGQRPGSDRTATGRRGAGAAEGPARRHRRHHRQPRRRPAVAGRARPAGAGDRSPRADRRRGVRQRLERPAHARAVAAAGEARLDDPRRRRRVRRRRGHLGHRHARGARLLPAPHRAQRQAGGGGRLDASAGRGGLRRRREPGGGRPRGGGGRIARPRHAGRDERRDPRRARRHQDRRAAARRVPVARRTARRRRRRSRGLRAAIGEARRSADGVRRADAVGAAARRRAADLSGRAGRSHPRRRRQRRRRDRDRHRRGRHQRHAARGAALRDRASAPSSSARPGPAPAASSPPASPGGCWPCRARSAPRTCPDQGAHPADARARPQHRSARHPADAPRGTDLSATTPESFSGSTPESFANDSGVVTAVSTGDRGPAGGRGRCGSRPSRAWPCCRRSACRPARSTRTTRRWSSRSARCR